jgi:hypothetical protein
MINKNIKFYKTHKEKVDASNESYDKIFKYMKNLDKLFKKKYNDFDTTKYFTILKDKKNKTEFAYSTSIYIDNFSLPSIINLAYSIKYHCNSKYDLICFVQNKSYYEKNYLNNTYKKMNGLSHSDIETIKELFDIVIDVNITKLFSKKDSVYDKLFYYILYDSLYPYAYTKYKKILYLANNVVINKNIDFLFDKYDKSTYGLDYLTKDYKGGLYYNVILYIPKNYYIKKIEYILKNYDIIFKKLFFIIPKMANVIYYTIFPDWSEQRFEFDLINYNFERIPYINSRPTSYNIDCYIDDYYAIYTPFNFHNLYSDIPERNKFNLNNKNFKKWDLLVIELLKKFPKYSKFFDFIKTYRNTLF